MNPPASNPSSVTIDRSEQVSPASRDAAPPRERGRSRRSSKFAPVLRTALIIVATVIVLGGVWELIKVTKHVSDSRLPHTWQVLRYFTSRTAQGENEFVFLLHNIGVTLKEASVGLILALSVGLVLGILIAKWPLFGRSVTPLLVLTQTLPLVAIAPALVIWLGQGWQAKAIIAALLAFFPVAVSVARGINDIAPDQRALFRSFGSSKRDVLIHLELPCALSQANAAVQTAAALGGSRGHRG